MARYIQKSRRSERCRVCLIAVRDFGSLSFTLLQDAYSKQTMKVFKRFATMLAWSLLANAVYVMATTDNAVESNNSGSKRLSLATNHNNMDESLWAL